MTNSRSMFALTGLLLAVVLWCPALSASADDDESGGRTYVGDVNSRWFHVGGGLGAITPEYNPYVAPVGRFVIGGGGYTFGLYATGGLEITGTEDMPLSMLGVGGIGVHIPIPVVHPMFGIKVGGGFANLPVGSSTAFTFGGQFGLIVREYDGRVGFRLCLEPSVTSYPMVGSFSREAFLTLALVL